MKLRIKRPRFQDLPQAGERIRLTDGSVARVVMVTTRWDESQDEAGRHDHRLLLAELGLVPDAKPAT